MQTQIFGVLPFPFSLGRKFVFKRLLGHNLDFLKYGVLIFRVESSGVDVKERNKGEGVSLRVKTQEISLLPQLSLLEKA